MKFWYRPTLLQPSPGSPIYRNPKENRIVTVTVLHALSIPALSHSCNFHYQKKDAMQHLGFRSRSPVRETLIISISSHFRPKSYISFSQSRRRLPKTSSTKPQILSPPNLNLRRLTSRIVDLTRRKRLNQVSL